MMDHKGIKIVIAGGGTGGHLFPGIAIAREFISRVPRSEIEVVFVGTDRPFEKGILSQAGFRHMSISAQGIKGKSLWQKLLSILKLPKGIISSVWILFKIRPDIVVGVGGYSAGPVVIGAWLLRIKRVLHEQNRLPGITNRLLSRFADRIFVSFDQTVPFFNGLRVVATGNPVRQEILAAAPRQAEARNRGKPKPFTVFIAGGSQGAHSINTAMVTALDTLNITGAEKEQYRFIHQTGKADEESVKAGYKRFGFAARVQSFITDMAAVYKTADLVICRAGATTVAEITVMGKAAIFIPYPYAADNHQVLNAKDLKAAGAAEVILEQELNGRLLAEKIASFADRPDRLLDMEKAALERGKPEAAKSIVDECFRLMNRTSKIENRKSSYVF